MKNFVKVMSLVILFAMVSPFVFAGEESDDTTGEQKGEQCTAVSGSGTKTNSQQSSDSTPNAQPSKKAAASSAQ